MGELIIYGLFAVLLVALTVTGIVLAVTATPLRRSWIAGAVAVWLGAFAFMTLRPGSGLGVRLNLVPIVFDGPGSAFDAFLNVFVFVPLGILLALAGLRVFAALGLALAFSLAIEITQYLTDLGRTADINDLITNVLGAARRWAGRSSG